MRSLSAITTFALFAAVAGLPSDASAQSCCGTPTVAYSPVVAAPTIAVQTQERSRLAKILDPLEIFSRDRVTTTVNYGAAAAPYTAGYSPYTAGYTPYTAGYSPYSVGYAPSPYTAAYTPQVAYRPTYPATYGAVAMPQTVSRPVVLSPVVSAPACNTCSTGCDACGGVEQAYYGAPSTGCSSCNSGASYDAPLQSYSPQPSYDSGLNNQRPTLAPTDNVELERSIQQKPEVEEDFGTDPVEGDPAAANEYWRAPPLFPPTNRVTQRSHPAPARTAVYRRPTDVRQTAFRPAVQREATRPESKVNRLDAGGWEAVAN